MKWPEMKSQQKPLGGSAVCGRSSAVPDAAAAAAAAGAEPVREPRPLSGMATSVARRHNSVGLFGGGVL